MRAPAVAITIWMFIMMMIVGVVGYAYVLWTQYWRTMAEREQFSLLLQSVRSRSSGQLGGNLVNTDSNYYYSTSIRDKPFKDHGLSKKKKIRTFNGTGVGNIRRYKPGTMLLHPIPLSRKRQESERRKMGEDRDNDLDLPTDKILNKVSAYRNQLIIQMRKSQFENRNANFDKNRQNAKNHYKVKFTGTRSQISLLENSHSESQRHKLLCQLKDRTSVKMLEQTSEPFASLGLGEYFPKFKLEETHQFNSCAIVSSAGSMYKSKLGPEIGKPFLLVLV